MAHGWDQKRAADHIDKKLADVEAVTIKNYVRDNGPRVHQNERSV